MVTQIVKPTTLAQFRVALAQAETGSTALSKNLELAQSTNEELSSDLKDAQIALKKSQEQLERAKGEATQAQERQAAEMRQVKSAQLAATEELEQARRQLAQVQGDLDTSRARAADIETQAGKKLAEATEVLNRLKLEAAAAADRELKLDRALDSLRKDLAQQRQAVSETTVSHDDLAAAVKTLRQQIDGLVEENRRIAVQRDAARSDQAVLRQHASEQAQRESAAVAAARLAAQADAEVKMTKVQQELQLLKSRVGSLSAQLASSGKLEVLAPDQVGTLMGGFLQKIEGSMPSLRLVEGELKLKLGLARTDNMQGFVIVPPQAGEDLQRSVHEIALKFDRSGAIAQPAEKP